MVKKEDIPTLNQLLKTLEDNLEKLEQFYEKKDVENFTKTKKLMFSLQNKILELGK